MKILQVVSYYYPHLGGIEQVARDYAYAFCRAGVGNDEQRIFCFRHDKGGDNTEEIDGVRVTRSKSFAKVASQSLSLPFKAAEKTSGNQTAARLASRYF